MEMHCKNLRILPEVKFTSVAPTTCSLAYRSFLQRKLASVWGALADHRLLTVWTQLVALSASRAITSKCVCVCTFQLLAYHGMSVSVRTANKHSYSDGRPFTSVAVSVRGFM